MSDNLPQNQSGDNWLSRVQEAAGGPAGRRLKFRKGTYFVDGNEIRTGSEAVAFIDQMARQWIKIKAGDVVERRIYKFASPEPCPERGELDDLDPKAWTEMGLDGKPKDPWFLSWVLPVEDLETAELWIFYTQSVGGIRALRELAETWYRTRRKGALPIIALRVGIMKLKTGDTPRPDFPIVGWEGGEPALPPSSPPKPIQTLTHAEQEYGLVDDEPPPAYPDDDRIPDNGAPL